MEVRDRWAIYRAICLVPCRKWLVVMPLALVGILALIRDEFLSPKLKEAYRLINLWDAIPWWAYIIGALALVVLITLESAYRTVRKYRDTAQGFRQQVDSRSDSIPVVAGAPLGSYASSRDAVPGLLTELENVNTVWAVWQTGIIARHQGAFTTRKIKKLILIDPTSDNVKANSNEVGRPVDRIIGDIIEVTQNAIKYGGEVRWHDGVIAETFLMSNPNESDAWVRIESARPVQVAGRRSSNRVFRSRDRQQYDEYVKEFNEMWNKARKPNQRELAS